MFNRYRLIFQFVLSRYFYLRVFNLTFQPILGLSYPSLLSSLVITIIVLQCCLIWIKLCEQSYISFYIYLFLYFLGKLSLILEEVPKMFSTVTTILHSHLKCIKFSSQPHQKLCQFSECFMITQFFFSIILMTSNVVMLTILFTFLIWYIFWTVQVNSVAQSCPTLCDPHGLQHARPPCPSLTPGVCSNSCPSRQWCNLIHPAISSSVVPAPPTFNLSQH